MPGQELVWSPGSFLPSRKNKPTFDRSKDAGTAFYCDCMTIGSMSDQVQFPADANLQKNRTGFSRIWHAAGYSLAGLREGWSETAFRQEALASLLLLPAALWLGQSWIETTMLAGTVMLVLIVELLNTGIEAVIDRIGPEWHALSKRAKDTGSAAVLLSLLLCASTWAMALIHRFGT